MSTNSLFAGAWTRVAAVLLLLGVALTAGCGSGNRSGSQSQAASVSSRGKGRVQMVVDWPARARAIRNGSRYIPAYAASLHFEMYQAASPNTRYVTTANRPNDRPSSQTVSFDDLIPEGTYTLAGVARTGQDGQGETVASAATQVKVVADQTFTVNLTLNSAIKSLSVLPQNPVAVGTTVPLAAQALDPDGKVVLLPGEALTWTLVSGASFATLSSTGVFTATAPGTVHVKVAETTANLSAEADITVAPAGGGGGGGGASGLANSSWPTLFGNAQHTGRGGGMGATGTLLWQYGDTTNQIQSGAVLGTDGTVYLTTGIGPAFGPYAGKLLALDGATGSVKWAATLGTGVPGAPSLGANGLIYVVYPTPGTDGSGTVLAVDQSGNVQWHFDTNEQYLLNSVAIGANGTVYVQGSFDLFALDAQTGTQKWKVSAFAYLYSTPALSADGGTLYVAGSSNLYAFDAASGAQKWKVSSSTGRFESPAVGANGMIYTINEDLTTNAYAFDSSGVQKWSAHIGDSVIKDTTPALAADGTVYVLGPGGTLFALDGATGAQKWTFEGKSAANFSAPSVDAAGIVYTYSDYDRQLHALDGQTGAQKFAVPTNANGNAIGFTAIGADGTLYFTGVQGVSAYR